MQQGHADDTADQAADGALHRLFRADLGGQLVLAAQHPGKEGEGVRPKGDGQRQKHQGRSQVPQQPQPQQAGEHQGKHQPCENCAGDSGKGDALLLVIPVDGQGEDHEDEHRSQQGGKRQHRKGGQRRVGDGLLQIHTHRNQGRGNRRQGDQGPALLPRRGAHQLPGADGAHGRQQKHGGPGRHPA